MQWAVFRIMSSTTSLENHEGFHLLVVFRLHSIQDASYVKCVWKLGDASIQYLRTTTAWRWGVFAPGEMVTVGGSSQIDINTNIPCLIQREQRAFLFLF